MQPPPDTMIIQFFCRSQIAFAQYCAECGCPDDLNMRLARLVYLLGDWTLDTTLTSIISVP